MHRGGQASGQRMRIRSLPPAVDEKYVNSIWDLLKKAIQEIQQKNNSGLSFEELYRNAYTMVLHKHGDRLYNGLRTVIQEHMHERLRPAIDNCSEGALLATLIAVWNDHTIAMVMIRDILMYMDRVYITQHNVEPVYHLGLSIFRDEIFRYNQVNDRIRQEMLNFIARERQGEQIDWISVKHATEMLSALGTYEADFEKQFLDVSREYYRRLSLKFLNENGAGAYIQRVEKCLREEKERAQRYLDTATLIKIQNVVEVEMIETHLTTVVEMQGSGLSHMLSHNQISDIRRMYFIATRVKQGGNVICEEFSRWVRQRGEEITDSEQQSEELKKDPILYITSLIELHDRCEQLLREAFSNNAVFRQRISNDFTHFVNMNTHSAEYLTTYIDDKLKKGNRVLHEAVIDYAVNRCMILFRFLSEKDMFEHFYKRSLAKRLLGDRSASDDNEKLMVSRLKTECGYQYTQKLELMFKDRELWNTLQAGYREYLNQHEDSRERDPCEIQVRVLTSGVWPMHQVSTSCILPMPAELSFKTFQDYYTKQHNGRKIMLNALLGNADLKAVFYTPAKADMSQQEEVGPSRGRDVVETQKILVVNTLQMTVLMLFNRKEVLSYHEIMEDTRIPENELLRTVQSLSMGKPSQRVLCRRGQGGKDIGADDTFFVNDGFTSKLVRIRISTIAESKMSPKDSAMVKERVEDDRKHEIECAIVRVMKARKRLEHNNLITEVIYQMTSRFKPTPLAIKQRIEALIDRDYLVRDKSNPKLYEYVS